MSPDLHASPDELASMDFYASLDVEPRGALVISDMSGHNFWWICNRCEGDEVRKAPRHYTFKSLAQEAATKHNEIHRGVR